MHSFLKIIAAFLLTALPAGAAMGQSFSPRNGGGNGGGNGNGSSNQDSSGYGRRQRNNNGSQDSSGYGNRRSQGNSDYGNSDNGSSFSKPSFGSRDSGSNDFGSKPSTPAAQPMAAPKSTGTFIAKPLPPDLAVLVTRSIFSRNHLAIAVPSEASKVPVFNSVEAKLIFRGAMQRKPDNHFVAFIEDSAGSKSPQWVGIGQTLTSNGGQIIDITLDNIVVEKGGSVRQIDVGDNLDAGTRLANPPVTASLGTGASSVAPATGAGSTGTIASPAPAVTASTTGTASDDAVAEMMRRRRVQELGQ